MTDTKLPSAPEEKVCGFVWDSIFSNEDTGYQVLEIETDEGDLQTIVGIMPDVEVGERIEAFGRIRNHSTYGDQLEVETYIRSLPDDVEKMQRYLGSGIIKGVGESLAHRITEKFKEKTFFILEQEPERLAEIKGISAQKAALIGEQFAEKTASRQAMILLQEMGLTPKMAMKVYQVFGAKTIQTVKSNPYLLAEKVQGIGFYKADEIAQKSGLEPDSPGRIRGAIRYVLLEAAQEGHTYLPEKELMDRIYRLIGFEGDIIDDALAKAQVDGLIFQKHEEGQDRIFLSMYYQAELTCARKLIALKALWEGEIERGNKERLEERISAAEKRRHLTLSDDQREALFMALTSGVSIITGGPGTGKTTIIRILLDVLTDSHSKVLLAAPTGRAAKRMNEACEWDARTIHRMLEIQTASFEDGERQQFARNETNPLEADVVIVDEASMIDVLLMSHLLKAVPEGARLVMLGDKDQLPSVGPGNVLKDMILSGLIPVKYLEHIYRQAQQSDIVVNAHRINQGQMLLIPPSQKHTDFFLMKRTKAEDILQTTLDVVKDRFPRFAHVSSIDDIQVLSPMKKGPLGVYSLNERLQDALNPAQKKKKMLKSGLYTFREGDKVIQTKNNYELEWSVRNKYGYALDEGKGVFNGDVGRIKSISEKGVEVLFDGSRHVLYDLSSLSQLELAYAITIHKAQGTESPVIVIPVFEGPDILFTRNLLYTGVTRARKYVVIIGKYQSIVRMIENDRQTVRFSSLTQRLAESSMQEQEIQRILHELTEKES
ncbi:MAG: ATP-dependent RecD-like DNA helicase [Firmicutes bacterium]|nr:ATP-dependent RecD-like DNA helicase [Bacillota bacterium]